MRTKCALLEMPGFNQCCRSSSAQSGCRSQTLHLSSSSTNRVATLIAAASRAIQRSHYPKKHGAGLLWRLLVCSAPSCMGKAQPVAQPADSAGIAPPGRPARRTRDCTAGRAAGRAADGAAGRAADRAARGAAKRAPGVSGWESCWMSGSGCVAGCGSGSGTECNLQQAAHRGSHCTHGAIFPSGHQLLCSAQSGKCAAIVTLLMCADANVQEELWHVDTREMKSLSLGVRVRRRRGTGLRRAERRLLLR